MAKQLRMQSTSGFTLIGLITVITISAIALPPMMIGFNAWLDSAHQAERMESAVQLAVDMMDEILAKDFCDPAYGYGSFGTGWDEDERIEYDDVDDYHGWSASPPEDFNGAVLNAYQGFTRSVAVENVTGTLPNIGQSASPGTTAYKRITVRIDWGGAFITIEALKVYFDDQYYYYLPGS